jgi:hypothetical protein
LKFRRHEQERERLQPALRARNGLPCFGGGEWRDRLLEHRLGIKRAAKAARELIGDIEPLREAVEPGGVVVGEAVGGGCVLFSSKNSDSLRRPNPKSRSSAIFKLE